VTAKRNPLPPTVKESDRHSSLALIVTFGVISDFLARNTIASGKKSA